MLDKGSLVFTSINYKMTLNNAEKKPDQKNLKSLVLVSDLKRMEQNQKEIWLRRTSLAGLPMN